MSFIKWLDPLPGWGPPPTGLATQRSAVPCQAPPLRLEPAREEVDRRRLLGNPASLLALLPSRLLARCAPFPPHSSLVSGCCLQGSRSSALQCVPSAPSPAPSGCPLVSCRRPGEWPFRKAPQVEKGLVAVDWHGSGGGRCRRPRGREGARAELRNGRRRAGVPRSGWNPSLFVPRSCQ